MQKKILEPIRNQSFEEGNHDINFNIQNLASGLYLCKIETGIDTKFVKFTVK